MTQARRILFFDIDGTLAMPGDDPSEAVVSAMRSARRKGHLLILSTGRTEEMVPAAVGQIGYDGCIYSAGGRSVVNGVELSSHTMEPARVRAIVAALQDVEGCFFTMECRQGSYHSDVSALNLTDLGDGQGSSELLRLVQLMKDTPARLISRYQGEDVYKISFFCTRRAYMDKAEAVLSPLGKVVRFEGLLAVSEVCAGEITAPGIDKGRSLREICAYFGAPVSQSVAFGDSMNDAEMLTAAGIGVAMGNAEQRLKALSDRVCERCQEDGVAKELERLGLC